MVEDAGKLSGVSPLISIIMPCYNVAQTVAWSISSIQRQIYGNFELICIDDCSSDETRAILSDLADRDPRIKLLFNESNIGSGGSRNVGLDSATGDYVAFVDADDYIEADFLSLLLATLIKNKADIAQCRLRYVYNDKSVDYGSPHGIISGEHCRYRIDIVDGLPFCTPHPCNKLYKRSLFDGLHYKAIRYEDTEILPAILSRCRKLSTITDVLYNYNKRFSQTTGSHAENSQIFDTYAQSIRASIAPYISPDFLSLLLKWKAPMPGAVHANMSNYFKSLDGVSDSLSISDKMVLYRKINALTREVVSNMPGNFSTAVMGAIYKPKKMRPLWKKYVDAVNKAHKTIFSFYLRFVERYLISRLDRIVPKKANVWTFASWGHYEQHTMDNPRALFESVKTDEKITKIVLMNGNFQDSAVAKEGVNVRFVKLASFRGLYWLLRANVVVVAYSIHSLFGYRRLQLGVNRRIIQLWHGIAVKTIGLRVGSSEPWWTREVSRYAFVPASSEVDRKVVCSSFAPRRSNIVGLTGLPRNDLIGLSDADLPSDYKNHLDSLRQRVAGRKFVLFAPTWRTDDESPCMFSLEQFIEIDNLFSKYDAVLGCRMHRNMMKSPNMTGYISDSVIYVNDIPDINIMFRECDAVVTDYSSLYLDFISLDRPIILYTPDISTYAAGRGFNYSPKEFLPHNFEVSTFEALLTKLEDILSNNFKTDESFQRIKARFQSFELDGKASHRVLQHIKDEV